MKNQESAEEPAIGQAYQGVMERLNDKQQQKRELIEHLCIRDFGKNLMTPQDYTRHRMLQRGMSFFSFALSVIVPASAIACSLGQQMEQLQVRHVPGIRSVFFASGLFSLGFVYIALQ